MRKTVLITGASRGIGAATALRLATDGYDVAINYHQDKSAARKIVAKIHTLGKEAKALKADVSDETQVVDLFHRFEDNFGQLNALVNNTGILFTKCRVIDMTADRINSTLQTNVTGAMICAREAVKRMSTTNGGSGGGIVNVSSAAARLGSANEFVDYAASKGAMDTFTIGLANEISDEGIRVNAVRPGLIHTDIHAAAGEPGRIERLKSILPIKRGGTPEEVAAAISWLLSDESSYCTGTFIDVSGGR